MVGILRFIRRLTVPVIRMISSPDDIFSVALLTVWLALSFVMAGQAPAFAVAKGQLAATAVKLNESPIVMYYIVTSFFLVYVPFSKISHYIYYPFSRWYLGRTMGHRGVYPIRRYQS